MGGKDRRRRGPLARVLSAGVAAFVVAILPGVVAGEPAPSPEELSRLESGEIVLRSRDVAGASLPHVTGIALIEAPPAKLWAIVSDCARFKETMPRTLESQELERNGDHIRCRVLVDMPFPFSDLTAETEAVHTISPDGSFKRAWTHRGGDFRANQGSWTLVPIRSGAATLATYEALMEPNVPIPNWILRQAQQVTLPSMLEGLRKQAVTNK